MVLNKIEKSPRLTPGRGDKKATFWLGLLVDSYQANYQLLFEVGARKSELNKFKRVTETKIFLFLSIEGVQFLSDRIRILMSS